MLWFKRKTIDPEAQTVASQCGAEAEALYRSGKYHCAEAVVEVTRRHFSPETPESVVRSVSGFGGGSGSGCICGAVAGGTVALGMVLGDKKLTSHLTRELHEWFKSEYGVTCCRTIRKNHKGACPVITGQVAAKVAEFLSRHE
ncbi:MAG: C-GCAxxG-C-C family protein [Desulfuromonadia bacterium]